MNTRSLLQESQLRRLPVGSTATLAHPPIQPDPAHPRYWNFRGQPTLFLGATDSHNLFQWPEVQLLTHLDALAAAGGNQLRNTMSDREKGNLRAFAEVAPGQYDLQQWNAPYWQRFQRFLEEASRRAMLVQIELWDRFDHSRAHWETDPYNPANNINYTAEESGLATEYHQHPGSREQPFFFTVPSLQNNSVVLSVQEAFITKVMEISLPFDNVLYSIDNETNGDPAWGHYWARFIRSAAREAGREIQVTQMWDDWDTRHGQHANTRLRPDLYTFLEASQNSMQVGEANWTNAQWLWREISDAPRPINATKIYGSDELATQWAGRDADNALSNFWRNVLGGFATSRFHRPPTHGLGLSPQTAAQISSVREIQKYYDIFRSVPDSYFSLLADSGVNEAYAASIPSEAWLIFFPDGGDLTLRTGQNRPLTLRLLSTDRTRWLGDPSVESGPDVRIVCPPGRHVALVLRKDLRTGSERSLEVQVVADAGGGVRAELRYRPLPQQRQRR